MFPIGDDNQDITTAPVVTWSLIAANVLVFIYQLSLGDRVQVFINDWGAIPWKIAGGERLTTLVTSMFMHGGFAHIFGNMLFLKVFGDNVEDRFGHLRFFIFYMVTGLVAGLAQVYLSPKSGIPGVGASGAISGILGAYIVLFRSNRVRVLVGYWVTQVPAWAMIGFWAAQQFLATYMSIARTEQTDTGGVAYAAHAGGFIAGAVIGLVAGRRRVSRDVPVGRSPL
ncbi:MAG: Rhomboid family protein [Chlorobi bacterium]|nr:Rhomboid family protein [Chlorobiota bacterium]